MKIAFVYKVDDDYWQDGLWAALNLIGEESGIEVEYINLNKRSLGEIDADFVLVWGALGSEQTMLTKHLDIPKGICIAGGPVEHPDIHGFDVVFVETAWHIREFRHLGVKANIAFGTNTKLFRPIKQVKVWDAIYPAAFAKWKRHDLFCRKPGKKLAVGYIQPDDWEKGCWEMCVKNKVSVLPMVKPEVLVWLYNSSKKVIITADVSGGGERAVLEGLACGLPVEVEPDNYKLAELLELQQKDLFTEKDYARALLEGIKHR